MTTAIFSNGYTDTYKGNRPVKAAWAIIRKDDGKVIASGHSLDRVKAEKTAHGNAASKWASFAPIYAPRGITLGHIKLERDAARRYGWDGNGQPRKFIEAENARRAGERAKLYTVEVIDI